VITKAEQTGDKANPRFIVTSLSMQPWRARALYEDFYCARGECENRIKEAQLDLFADRLSAATFRANQLCLWLASAAYVLMHAPYWPEEHGARARLCEHDPAQTAENRCRGEGECTARQTRYERGLCKPARVHCRLPCLERRGALSRTHEPDTTTLNHRNAVAHGGGHASAEKCPSSTRLINPRPAHSLRPHLTDQPENL
jgi:Transposase DDE domain group 1